MFLVRMDEVGGKRRHSQQIWTVLRLFVCKLVFAGHVQRCLEESVFTMCPQTILNISPSLSLLKYSIRGYLHNLCFPLTLCSFLFKLIICTLSCKLPSSFFVSNLFLFVISSGSCLLHLRLVFNSKFKPSSSCFLLLFILPRQRQQATPDTLQKLYLHTHTSRQLILTTKS